MILRSFRKGSSLEEGITIPQVNLLVALYFAAR